MFEKTIDLNEAMLTEAFDTVEGYNVVNMKPNSGTPQIFLIQNDAEEDLIVRMMALSGEGDKLRVLKPTDKNVIVELMSINNTGRHTVLKGGIGSNPMKTIVTIFDTVVGNLNLNLVDTIMFRFQAKKMGGQIRSIQRILDRLALTRGKGKFIPLKEVSNFTGKFAYVVLHKKRMDLEKLPGAKNIDEKFKKVETKVGEVFVNDKTGEQVSKSEVIAQALVDTVNKISDKEMLMKTKLSKIEIIKAQYAPSYAENSGGAGAKRYAKLMDKETVIVATPDNESGIDGEISSSLKRQSDRTKEKIETGFADAIRLQDPNEMQFNASATLANRWFEANKKDHTKEDAINMSLHLAAQYERIVSSITLDNSYDKLQEIVTFAKSLNIGGEGDIWMAAEMVGEAVEILKNSAIVSTKSYKQPGLTDSQKNAVAKYADDGFKKINDALIGFDALSAPTEKLIEELDQAIVDHGISLAKGTKVYRGMVLKRDIFNKIKESKIFYFKNFVSTSLSPIIFTGYGDVSVTRNLIAPDGKNTDEAFESVNMIYPLGLIISGADKIKSLIPGDLSKYDKECEVILPRGVAIKFNKAISSNISNKGALLVEASIINPEDLAESVEVFDGDHFMETGEIKLVPTVPDNSFSFANFEKKLELEQEIEKLESKETLANIFSGCVDSINYKFMQA